MITQQQKSQIKSILQHPSWPLVEQIANELRTEIKLESCPKDTEWETVRTVIGLEGEYRGISRFLKKLYEYAA